MRVSARSLACVLLVAWTLAVSAKAEEPATDPPGYRAAIDDALQEYALEQYAEARALFARADALFHNARTLRGLAMADFELRQYRECIAHMEAALGSPVRALTGSLRSDGEALLSRARQFVVRVSLRVSPSDVQLRVDGVSTPLPKAQEPVVLEVGAHELEFSATGYSPERRSLRLTGGEDMTLEVKLTRLAVEASRGPAEPDAQPSAQQAKRWYRSPWLWTAVGIVVGGGIAAAVIATQGNRTQQAEPYTGNVGTLGGP